MIGCFYEGLLHLLVTLTHWVIVLSISGLWQWFISLFESSFFTTLIGAIIGGYATFYAVQYEIKKQNEADQSKEETEEQNKLRYLLFLIEDIYRVVDTYDVAASTFASSVAQNIYYIPDMPSYSHYSLEAIVTKIDQEQYYLSALRQLNDPNFPEVFRRLNSLEMTYRDVMGYLKEQFPQLVQAKMDFGESANAIPGILSSFMNGPQLIHGVPHEVTSMYNDCVALFNDYPETLHLDRLEGLNSLLPRLKRYFESVTSNNGDYWKQLSPIVDKNRRYRGRMMNITNAIIENREAMNRSKSLISQHAASLKQYVDALPS